MCRPGNASLCTSLPVAPRFPDTQYPDDIQVHRDTCQAVSDPAHEFLLLFPSPIPQIPRGHVSPLDTSVTPVGRTSSPSPNVLPQIAAWLASSPLSRLSETCPSPSPGRRALIVFTEYVSIFLISPTKTEGIIGHFLKMGSY